LKHIKELAGQTVIYGLSSIVARFLNYLLTPIYTYSAFSTTEYGDVTILYAYIALLNIILTYGMETGFFFFSKKETDFSKVYGTAFLSLLVTTLFFVFISLIFLQPISNFLEYGNKPQYIFWFILILGFDTLTAIPFAKLRQQNKAFKFALIKLLNVLFTIFFNLLLIYVIPKYFLSDGKFLGFNFKLSVELIFISNLAGSFITLLFLFPDIVKSKIKFSFSLWKGMINYSYPLMFAGLLGTVNETLDRILLQHFLPYGVDVKSQIGIYGACVKIAVLMTLFTQMFRFAAEPFFFNKSKSSDQKFILADVSKYFIIYGLIIFLGVMFYLDIIKYFIGPKYHSGLSVIWVYMIGSLGLGIYFNLSFWYKLTGKTYYGLIITAIGAFLTVILNILLIPKYGYTGSAWARNICYLIIILISYFLGQKYYRVNYQVKPILLYFAITLILFWICVNFKFDNLILDLAKNTFVLLSFIYYLEKKEKIISVFIKSHES
jgi:O-antigen/teichoic acid export membrane protein